MKPLGMVLSGGGVALASLVGTAAFLHTTLVCGCEPDGYAMYGAFRTNPMKDDPVVSRAGFLAAVPKGSPLSVAEGRIGIYYERHCKPSPNGAAVTCRFDMEESSFRGIRRGFEFTIKLDAAKTVQDVEFSRYEKKT